MKLFMSVLFLITIGCATTNTTGPDKMPKCEALIGDFYKKAADDNMSMAGVVETPYSIAFSAISAKNPYIIKSFCLVSPSIPKDKFGCTKVGDLIGHCSLGDSGMFSAYGEGEIDIRTMRSKGDRPL
jgi:hypothetical protein